MKLESPIGAVTKREPSRETGTKGAGASAAGFASGFFSSTLRFTPSFFFFSTGAAGDSGTAVNASSVVWRMNMSVDTTARAA